MERWGGVGATPIFESKIVKKCIYNLLVQTLACLAPLNADGNVAISRTAQTHPVHVGVYVLLAQSVSTRWLAVKKFPNTTFHFGFKVSLKLF